ncbi:MAG: 30S ribosomal protein S4e [Nitrososphaerota archaeon]|nr:30S ribosomal protein S4e [Aigarchaeota archaeon]MDW8076265.1 30S ribosomal protein S4e [Nitrososphaerota archaeon]
MGHLKRFAAPRHFRVPVKAAKFTVKPSPGPHPAEGCIPLGILLRDHLKYAESMTEAKKIIKERKILVDWRVITDHKFPVGLMDVVSIPETGEHFRIVPKYRKGLALIKIEEDESKLKIGKIIRKMYVNNGHLQLTLHDGNNFRFKEVGTEVLSYKTGDSLVLSFPEKNIIKHLKLSEGNYALVIKGPEEGRHGKIIEIKKDVNYPAKPTVTLDVKDGKVTTLLSYIMVVGEGVPMVTLE